MPPFSEIRAGFIWPYTSASRARKKPLRAFIYSREEEPIFSHSVAYLLKLAASIDPEFREVRSARLLDAYYISTRYPDGLPGETPSEYYDDENEVDRALELSRRIVELSEKKILL